MSAKSGQNYINHIALVLDKSYSMQHLAKKVVQVADDLVAFLAKESREKDQETRVTIYSFDDKVQCHIWDKDVLRLPSMAQYYQIGGNTALIDATMTALADGAMVTEKYGDHAFLVYVITDGEENCSRGNGVSPGFGRLPHAVLAQQMRDQLKPMGDNRTVAVLVPNDGGVTQAKQFGFENILIWDTSSEAGLEVAASAIKTATSTYMDNRTKGVRSTRSLFVGGNVDAAAVKAANLKPMPTSDRQIVIVTKTKDAFEKVVKPVTKSRLKPETAWFVEIEKFVNLAHPPYRVGKAYYELVKTERIQGDKEIAVVDVNTNKAYVGAGARQLLGLPEEVRTVKPEENGQYKIYVQSSSLNRHLPIGSHVLLLTN